MVTIWNNNVYGDSLVLLASTPEREASESSHTITRSSSFTGQVIQDCDIIYVDDLSVPRDQRTFENPQIIRKYGLSKLVGIPICDPFDNQLITCVINIYLEAGHWPAILRDRRVLDWLATSTSVHLDYLLYRIDEDVKRAVTSYSPTATGVAPLFEKTATDIQGRLSASAATLFLLNGEGELEVGASSEITAAIARHPKAFTITTAQTLEERCLTGATVSGKKPFMMVTSPDKDETAQMRRRWNYMAVPVISNDGHVLGVLQCRKDHGAQTLDSFSAFDLQILEYYQRALAPSVERFLLRVKSGSPLLRFLDSVVSATVGAADLGDSLAQAIRAIANLFNADTASIYVLEGPTNDPDRQRLVLKAASGMDAPLLALPATYRIGEGITGTILKRGKINLRTEEERLNYPGRQAKFNKHIDYRHADRKHPAFLGVAIYSRGNPVGALKIEYISPSPEHPEAYFTDDDEHTVSTIAAFLGFLIEHHAYRVRLLNELKLLAQNALDIERTFDEHAAIVAVMGALEKSGWGDALLSLYDNGSQVIGAYLSSRHPTDVPLGSLKVLLSSDDIRAVTLRENRCEFVPGTLGAHQRRSFQVLWNPESPQYVLPLRIDGQPGAGIGPELLGTLQVIMPSADLDSDAVLILQAFAGHLSVALSRTRVIKRAIELAEKVIPSVRFVVAETLAGMVVHSLGHELKVILGELDQLLSRTDFKGRRDLVDPLREWRKKLNRGESALQEILREFRPDALDDAPVHNELEPLLQPTVDLWYSLLHDAGCTVRLKRASESSFCRLSQHGFREILSVLIVNSVQAHAHEIVITTRRDNRFITPTGDLFLEPFCLDFVDDGAGLPTNDIEVIFGPTFTTKPAKMGTGLGLYFARKLARGAGGDLYVVREPRNAGDKGTAFRLILPTDGIDNQEVQPHG